jgi:phospholipase C
MRGTVILSILIFAIALGPVISRTKSAAATPVPVGAPIAGSPIQHVIVVVQENRTFDNLFASSILAHGGPYPGANTSQTTTVDGKPMTLKAVPFEYPADPSHNHLALLGEWNRGRMDGFVQEHVTTVLGLVKPASGFPYAYLPYTETTIYHLLAARYALADENFATRLVPTFPSHYTLMTGQSRIAGNPNDAIWGCDSKPGTTVPLFGKGEAIVKPGIFPCFDQMTVADLLDAAQVSWKAYTGAYNDASNPAVNIFDAFRKIRYGPDWERNVITPSGTILSDIQSCRLPQVSFVMPNWLDSDHAGNLSAGGPGWVGSVYLAIVQSQHAAPACNYYKNSALILTWDDSGGWYDHVAPPPGPNGVTWGFRIPILVLSAWAHSGYDARNPQAAPYVSHTRRESTSILRFIEKNWALGNLGQRDATDDDLSDMFDYTRTTPIPSFSEVSMKNLIRRTRYNLAVADRNDHVVDDDR